MNYNNFNPYYSSDMNYLPQSPSQYAYNGYYNPYSYYTYECTPCNLYNNKYLPENRDVPSRPKRASTRITKTVHNFVKPSPEPTPEIRTSIETVAPEPIVAPQTNESKPAQKNDDFEFIEIKGIRGIWVKKDGSKNASIMINNYLLENDKEKLIEECEPSEPIVIRERPPEVPKALSPRVITIPGKRLSPPARRVVIEKQSQPPQPQKVIVERWLPYDKPDRRIIVQKAPEPCVEKPKNLIIEWEPVTATTEKKIQILGVESADPNEYVAKYGSTLKTKSELPKFALNVKGPDGVSLDDTAASLKDHKLVGDLEGLNLIDLDKEGLSMYKKYLEKK